MSKGICFKEPLFHKVVKGEKIQTRRIIDHFGNKEHYGKLLCHWGLSHPPYLAETGEWRWELQTEVDDSKSFIIKPKYKVGEKVHLKEPYSIIADYEKGLITKYKFDYPPTFSHKWSNKLFMPESAARFFIEITAVRAERLQDISEEDCLKEGIELYNNYDGTYGGHSAPTAPKEAYAALINSIYGKGTWEKNPFVWVYEFRLIQR